MSRLGTRATNSTNPFTQQIVTLDATVFIIPNDIGGFKARLIVLFILCGLVCLLGCVYLVLIGIDLRRKQVSKPIPNRFNLVLIVPPPPLMPQKPWWFFRLVQRPSGRYIATK